MNLEKEVTKEEFKSLYFRYSTPDSGWTGNYWDKFFEKEENKRYFFAGPASQRENRMFIVTDKDVRRMVFLSEESEESFFDFSGKE